jgi:DNA-binding NtrC family response regulator
MEKQSKIRKGRRPKVAIPADYKTLEQVVAMVERDHIDKTLKLTGWNLQKTSRTLDIARNTLKAKISKYGIR